MTRTKKSARRGKRNADVAPATSNKKQKKNTPKTANATTPAATAITNGEKGSREWAENTLTKLLGGMSLDTFLSEYFEKKPLHVRKADKGALFDSNLFSRKKLLKVMEKQHRSLSFGKDLTVCRYVDSERENFDGEDTNGHATSRQVASLLDRGYSCQFYQPQRYEDGLYELNAAFEDVFGGLAGSSAYLTPANSQALAPHHDDVEVFVVQTQGRKKWKLYHPLVELAGEHSSDLAEDQIGEPWMELTVEEGDFLYFPRGVIHQACTDEKEFSTHVTISVYQHNTWANFLEVALPRVIRHAFDSDVSFREGLPVGYLDSVGTQFPADSAKAKEFMATCKKLVGKLAAHVSEKDLQEAADEAALDVLANRLPPPSEGKDDDDESGPSPLDGNVSICFKNRSHIRLSIGEDEMKEAFVAVYFSLHNCRRHHMGLCTCDGGDDEEGKEREEEGDGSDAGEEAETSSADGDHGDDQSDDEDGDLSAAFGQMPPQPKSIAFPGDLAPALMKLYATSTPGASIDELAKAASDETAVRGMLLRLWSEGLLDVTTQP
ncbi:Cupin superfamily protein [Phytophthora infestans]|uniref:Bifunctional lysine-specific demethylase and histidyl-hydroxylase n=1 Tax=Phytophthora infestans TaxID=4787 RepID=A0A833WJQ6_PHYIN|nr:Cupin superfamily protein [Phytophthora infestans]